VFGGFVIMVLSNSKLKRKRKEEATASAAVLIPPQDTSPAAVAVTDTVVLVSGSAVKPSTKKTKKRRILNKTEGEAVKAPSIKPADGEGKEEERVVKDDDDGDAGLVSRKNEATLDGAKEQGIKLQKPKNKRKNTSGIQEEGESNPLEKSRKEGIEDGIVWVPTEEEVGKERKRTKKSEKNSRKPKKPETEDSPAAGDPDEGFRLNATAEDNEEQDQNGTAAAERKLRVKPRWPLVDGKRVKPGSAPLAVANNVVEPSESKGNEGNGTAAAEEQLLNNPETDDGVKSGEKTAPEVTIEGVEDKKQKKKNKKKKATDKWGKIIEPEAPVQEEDGRQFKSNEAEITTNETLMSNKNSLLATSFDLKKVVVGGMPYYSTEDDIRDFFSECGTIEELDCMTFPDTGKFRGIGFITFKTEAAAERALALNGADMGGRFLKIELCKVKPKAESEKQVHHEAPKKVQGCTSAYIGNLAWDVTEADLRKFFKKCKIDAIRFALDKDSGEFRGFGHIDFADDESLEAAVKLDQQFVCGRPLKIAYSVPKRNQRDRSTEQLDRTKQPKTCFTCNEPGHMSYNCPKKELV